MPLTKQNKIKNKSRFQNFSDIFILLSGFWLLVNIAAVYLFLDGMKSHRIETASFIFASAVLLKLVSMIRRAGKEQGTIFESVIQPKERFLLAAAPVLVLILLYLPLSDGPFLSDDYVFIEKYMNSPFDADGNGFFRPVFGIVFHLLLKTFGLHPAPFHIFNLLLHIISAVLVYRIVRKIFDTFFPAYFSALFFLLNPFQAEAVFWISGLQETLWVFFFLSAAAVYINKREINSFVILIVISLMAMSLLSKETAVCFLPLFAAFDFLLFGFRRGKNLKYAYSFFVLLIVAYLVLRGHYTSIPSAHLTGLNLYFLQKFISRPFNVFLYPWNQAFLGPMTFLKFLISSFMVLLISTYFLYIKERRDKIFGIMLSLIYFPLIPLIGMFYVAPDLQGSRYLYLSFIGWGMLAGLIIFDFIRKRVALLVLSIFIISGLSFSLALNLKPWERAGEIINELPKNLINSPPDNYCGAYILRNGFLEYKRIQQLNDGSFKTRKLDNNKLD